MNSYPPSPVIVNLKPATRTQAGKNAPPLQAHFHATTQIAPELPAALSSSEQSRARRALLQFLPYEAALMEWIGRSNQNAQLFVRDPFQALQKAKIPVPAELVAELKALAQMIVATAKK
ncbi:MAG TPA: hypothetical protein VEX43_10340 [Chthoniobacterales bacterium]|nr:hypothetical protein [Chthoniobacterales bacterium]